MENKLAATQVQERCYMKFLFILSTNLLEYISKFKEHSRKYGFREALKKSIGKLKTVKWTNQLCFQPVSTEHIGTAFAKELGALFYQCNICGKLCKSKISGLQREESSCTGCGSTVRMRAIIHVLSMELFGKSLVIRDFPVRPDVTGMGMSDWDGYAIPLSRKFSYKNTYYHKEPKLDITSIDSSLEGTLDFIISSDVFEHVLPPVSIAFENARKILKPGGVLIFSVPYTKDGTTIEHFPDLYKYEIIKKGDGYILKNITRDGVEQMFDNLVFHGGAGATLEMRVFSESSLKEDFAKAGFSNIKIYKDPDFDHGIYWNQDLSLPIAARK